MEINFFFLTYLLGLGDRREMLQCLAGCLLGLERIISLFQRYSKTTYSFKTR